MMNKKGNVLMISSIIAGVGALNWGLIGITNYMGSRFDLVEAIANLVPAWAFHIQNILYIIVGLSAVVMFSIACPSHKNKSM